MKVKACKTFKPPELGRLNTAQGNLQFLTVFGTVPTFICSSNGAH